MNVISAKNNLKKIRILIHIPCSAADVAGALFNLQGEWVRFIIGGPPGDVASVVSLLWWHGH